MINKWSHDDVKRLSLSSGVWYPGGRNSSWVSQFLPSGCGSTYQMAAEWKDSYQGDLSPWWFWQLCFCSVWGRCPAERGEQTQRCAQLSAQLSARLCSLDWSCFHESSFTFSHSADAFIQSELWMSNIMSNLLYKIQQYLHYRCNIVGGFAIFAVINRVIFRTSIHKPSN